MSEHPDNKGKTGVVATVVAAVIGAGAIGSCMSKGAKTAKAGRTLERIEDGQVTLLRSRIQRIWKSKMDRLCWI